VARAALGPLFRGQKHEEFLRAWRVMPDHEPWMRDMLWHLMETRLGGAADQDLLVLLEQEIRRPLVHVDLARLGPQLKSVFGRVHVHELLEAEMEKAIDGNVLEELRALRRRF
jgi:hypothetical protein